MMNDRNDQEIRDEVFLIRLEEWLMRMPTADEEEIAFEMRASGYSAQDIAAHINEPAVA